MSPHKKGKMKNDEKKKGGEKKRETKTLLGRNSHKTAWALTLIPETLSLSPPPSFSLPSLRLSSCPPPPPPPPSPFPSLFYFHSSWQRNGKTHTHKRTALSHCYPYGRVSAGKDAGRNSNQTKPPSLTQATLVSWRKKKKKTRHGGEFIAQIRFVRPFLLTAVLSEVPGSVPLATPDPTTALAFSPST